VDNPLVMVEDLEGMGHFLQRDTLIGKNWGKVVRISPAEVIVAEEYRDFEGKLIVNEIPMKLPAEKDTQ
jgi:Tfp pilus assembly protein PilP